MITRKGSADLSQKKRVRNNRIYFHLDENEKRELDRRMEAVGVKNRDAFVRKMVLDGYIVNIDMAAVSELVRLLRISSNNINQMAKRANETGSVYEDDVLGLLAEVNNLKPLINEAHRELIALSRN